MVKNNKKGQQGIGTLIIFIALILVAAIAAGVLIRTSGNLQGKAEVTGSQVQERLGTGFSVVQVVANDTSDGMINANKDEIAVTVQLAPGSDPIKFSDVTISLVTEKGTQSYDNGTSPTTTTYKIVGVKGNLTDGYFNREDVATLEFITPYNISENEKFTIRLYPGVGNPQPIDIVTPPSMTQKYTVLK